MADDPDLLPNGVLRNLGGLTDRAALVRFEGDRALARAVELADGQVPMPAGFGGARLRAIHGHLFRDVYAWAGTWRTTGIWKGEGSQFAPPELAPDAVERVGARVAADGDAALVSGETRITFLAEVLADLNYAHPFRDGNGRAQREWARQLGAEHGLLLVWSRATPRQNVHAFVEAMEGRREPLRALLRRVVVR